MPLLHWTFPALALVAGLAIYTLVRAPAADAGPALCPEPKTYTADEEKRARAELLALPSDSIVAVLIVDYGRERAQLRACGGKKR